MTLSALRLRVFELVHVHRHGDPLASPAPHPLVGIVLHCPCGATLNPQPRRKATR